jgi:probable FeS assembly SUF system protein SufT
MDLKMNEPKTLRRDCEVLEIPSGIRHLLPVGTMVRISQALGDSYTVATAQGGMYRMEGKDADALGLSVHQRASAPPETFSEETVWAELRTVFDPEIPVNIVDLGLIYSCLITPLPVGTQEAVGSQNTANRIEIQMTLTAPGCGMADVLKADVERKLARLPGVKEVSVEVVFDPPWDPSRMTEAAKLQLGLDLDFSPSPSVLPIYKSRG